MAKKPNTPNQQHNNPSKLLSAFALVIAFSLPYFLVKNFSHPKVSSEANVSLSLPEGIEDSSLTDFLLEDLAANDELPEDPAADKSSLKQVPANNTATLKQAAIINKKSAPVTKDNTWQTVQPRKGDSMASIFHRLGLSGKNLHAVVQKNPYAKALTAINPKQRLRFLINKKQLDKLIIPVNTIQTLTITRVGNQYKTTMTSKKSTPRSLYLTATVRGSLYSTAQRHNIPAKLIKQMTQILGKEVDFTRAVGSGDQFSLVYDGYFIENKMVGIGDILLVSYRHKNNTFQAIRHTNAAGEHDYYTPNGNSLKKAFSRYPIKFSHISSTFALSRYHPILHYRRAHKGIDLAASIGTPIQATGDGVITIIDRHNGYGNMIKIKHDKTYSTVYGHLLRFQKGLSRGSKVKRGQVIGYVGQTGLASGPHCHYELHVNNEPRNPTTIKLPTAAPVPRRELAAFKAKTGMLLAGLKSYEKTTVASKGKKRQGKLG